MTDKNSRIQVTEMVMQLVSEKFAADGSGHGIDHIMRVYRMAVRIAEEESCDTFIVSIAALLHDVGRVCLTTWASHNIAKDKQEKKAKRSDVENVNLA